MDSLIQLGRRHNNAQPGPHPFNMPEDNELHTLVQPRQVATRISGINPASSPGFNTITPTFKEVNFCACKRILKQNDRNCEIINVLIPHTAAPFKLLIVEANIPRSWKEAKSLRGSRLQKGPVT